MRVEELSNLPPMPVPQEEGLLWFVHMVDAWDKDIAVTSNEELGFIVVWVVGTAGPGLTQAAAITKEGDFLDLTGENPRDALVVLHHRDYAEELAGVLSERSRRN